MTLLNKKPTLVENRVFVSNLRERDRLIQKGFGERKGKELILDLFESLYLLEKKKIEVYNIQSKKITSKKLLEVGLNENKEFHTHYLVYFDLRDKGYTVKTGFKFGSHFRVYPKGKKQGTAHTKWTVTVQKQNSKKSMHQLSRIARLSQTLHTKALVAVVDSDNQINFYEFYRVLP